MNQPLILRIYDMIRGLYPRHVPIVIQKDGRVQSWSVLDIQPTPGGRAKMAFLVLCEEPEGTSIQFQELDHPMTVAQLLAELVPESIYWNRVCQRSCSLRLTVSQSGGIDISGAFKDAGRSDLFAAESYFWVYRQVVLAVEGMAVPA